MPRPAQMMTLNLQGGISEPHTWNSFVVEDGNLTAQEDSICCRLLSCFRYQGLVIRKTNMLYLLIGTTLGYQVIIGLELGNRSSLTDSRGISNRICVRSALAKTVYNTIFIYDQLFPDSFLSIYLSIYQPVSISPWGKNLSDFNAYMDIETYTILTNTKSKY